MITRFPPIRRSRRDWIVDWLLFLAALTYGFLWAIYLQEQSDVGDRYLLVDQIIGAAGCLALWLRRRAPVLLACVLIPLSAYGDLVDGALLVALFTVAIHRPVKITAAVVGLDVLCLLAYIGIRSSIDPPDQPISPWLSYTLTLLAAVIGWGLFVRNRRQLIMSYEERAERAETEARLRAEQAQHLAREEIAREMHDVLGHRLSLLSVHAGALEYRPDAPPEEVARTAGVIRSSAHQALQDLRDVIGVLRAPVTELPQPTLADLDGLIDEARQAGTAVTLDRDVEGEPPERLGRTVYRIVQEGLTNVRKHASGTDVIITVAGEVGGQLLVEVVNTTPQTPRAANVDGQGLIGLSERVALLDGRLDHGPTADGGFRLAASLPWPT